MYSWQLWNKNNLNNSGCYIFKNVRIIIGAIVVCDQPHYFNCDVRSTTLFLLWYAINHIISIVDVRSTILFLLWCVIYHIISIVMCDLPHYFLLWYAINHIISIVMCDLPHYFYCTEWSTTLFQLWCAISHIASIVKCDLLHCSWGRPRGVMVKALDCGFVVREFELQSCYYLHFRTNTLRKGMNALILPSMGLILPLD